MLWTCRECTTKYAIDLVRCPHCGSLGRSEDIGDEDMPKISTHAGATIEGSDLQPEVTHVASEPVSERGEETSVGTSLPMPLEVSESKEEIQVDPALTTESHTVEPMSESSTADSADTSQSDADDGTTRRKSSRRY